MYSGTTLTRYSGNVLGAHQKINRVARRHLALICPEASGFPSTKLIQHFEGKNGPDGLKRKSPSRDEPQHWYDPFDDQDSDLLSHITEHYQQLVKELVSANKERAAFEAAWLSHALVDGLTPAHHFPFESKLTELSGRDVAARSSVLKKNVMSGHGALSTLLNNWRYWGPKGLFTTHYMFEWGLATIMAPLKLSAARPSFELLRRFYSVGSTNWFKQVARRIAQRDLYSRFHESGWTPALAREVRTLVAPEMVQVVCLFWHSALVDAELATVTPPRRK